MERATIDEAKELFGINFIGKEELRPLLDKIEVKDSLEIVPDIQYPRILLESSAKDYILILGVSEICNKKLSINTLRSYLGINPAAYEPCFYNQDWYLNETFIHSTLEYKWYLIKKNVIEDSRARQPNEILDENINFPSAILCVYTFFAYFFAQKQLLWKHDFIWCSDKDYNGDRIYVGKYEDIACINKNGFSIHRHLSLRECYGCVNCI